MKVNTFDPNKPKSGVHRYSRFFRRAMLKRKGAKRNLSRYRFTFEK